MWHLRLHRTAELMMMDHTSIRDDEDDVNKRKGSVVTALDQAVGRGGGGGAGFSTTGIVANATLRRLFNAVLEIFNSDTLST